MYLWIFLIVVRPLSIVNRSYAWHAQDILIFRHDQDINKVLSCGDGNWHFGKQMVCKCNLKVDVVAVIRHLMSVESNNGAYTQPLFIAMSSHSTLAVITFPEPT